eukprot:TRINITY_DN74184_c0_g1_i1.p3 TRINITY_DN74184_c0_g1~~TRINITY_DN74184_c0_g1_i1.p3  ORF type:complete len:162 (-),score=32.04 TRINITY_DN74184_c0_g1_i1:146-631(-)
MAAAAEAASAGSSVGESGGYRQNLVESWQRRSAVVSCLRHLRGAGASGLTPVEQEEVAAALDPPLALIVAAGGVYAATFVGLRRSVAQLRARPLLLQLAACLPAGAFLCTGGLFRSYGSLRSIVQRRLEASPAAPGAQAQGQLNAGWKLARCGELALPGRH